MVRNMLVEKQECWEELIDAIKTAEEILKGTSYEENIRMIPSLFETFNSKNNDIVHIQVRLIDSCYSTNLKMNPGSFLELSRRLAGCSANDFLVLLSDWNDNNVGSIFYEKIGQKRQPSFVSKYAYFLTGYKFPIYDSLVRDGYKLLSKRSGGAMLFLVETPQGSPAVFS